MFVEAAAERWSVPAGEIAVKDSVVSHASGKSATFADLLADDPSTDIDYDGVSGPIERLSRQPGRLHAPAVIAAAERLSEVLRRNGGEG